MDTVSKLTKKVIWFILGILGYAVAQNDTVYVTSSAALVQLQYGTTVKNILPANINADTVVLYGQGTQIIFKDVQVEVQRFTISSFVFKINGAVVSGSQSIYTAVNALNTGTIPTMKLIQTYRVVSALPTTLEPMTTYFVGNQTEISLTGLDGNLHKQYTVEGVLINPTSGDFYGLRFNGITGNVYDLHRAAINSAGSIANTNQNAQTSMIIASASGSNSLNNIRLDIYAQTGMNRTVIGQYSRTGASQQTITETGNISGIWRDNSTNIASIQLRLQSAADGVGVGTVIRLYGLK